MEKNLFETMGLELPPEEPVAKPEPKKAKKGNACGATKTAGKGTTVPQPPKEPEKDLPRFVVVTTDNYQETFPKEMTLEEIRVELEKTYPAYSKGNTNWHFEKQDDQYLCIPAYKSNKGG